MIYIYIIWHSKHHEWLHRTVVFMTFCFHLIKLLWKSVGYFEHNNLQINLRKYLKYNNENYDI